MARDILYSTMTFLTDAPLAQLDRALDHETHALKLESSMDAPSTKPAHLDLELSFPIPPAGMVSRTRPA
jgi:hypothetical protein